MPPVDQGRYPGRVGQADRQDCPQGLPPPAAPPVRHTPEEDEEAVEQKDEESKVMSVDGRDHQAQVGKPAPPGAIAFVNQMGPQLRAPPQA